jgi:hypothetical protein
MNNEKHKKALKLKTCDEYKHDNVSELNFLSKIRRPQSILCTSVTTARRISDEDNIEDQVFYLITDFCFDYLFFMILNKIFI